MKTFLALACALLVGAVIGVFCARAYYARELYTESIAGIRQVGEERATCIALSLGVLDQLEADERDRAKSTLAQLVSSYYRTFHDFQPMSPETQRLMQRIESSSEKSPALREALKTPPH